MGVSAAAEAPKLIYVVVADEGEGEGGSRGGSFRYTRPVLQSTLQLMGCKPRHAFKISRRAYEIIHNRCLADGSQPDDTGGSISGMHEGGLHEENDLTQANSLSLRERRFNSAPETLHTSGSIEFEWYKKQATAFVKRETFVNLVCDALSEYKYVGPNQRADLVLACRIRERKESVTILLCGTSGCGKSTLSALLGSRLGITTVISTDSVRHMMRSFVDEHQNPLLWASTYHAGECLDTVAVAQAKAKKKAKKLAGPNSSRGQELTDGALNEQNDGQPLDTAIESEIIGKKQMAVEGYKAQSEMVIDSLDRLIFAWEDRKESAVVEGVHLSLNFVMGLMKKHPSIIPFMIYIANEDKHVERFAVRAKYMTLDPARNKYVKYIRNIRTIQEYLCNRADKHLVPKINNTNVDRSVAAIHATVFSCLRRRGAGEELYDSTTNTVALINEEYRKQCTANSMSSKGMYKLIQRQGSLRHMMALINTDGSVAKAWPVECSDGKTIPGNAEHNLLNSPIYGPLKVGKAESVNLQFGTFGISAWPSDVGGTSHTGTVDDDDADCTDTGSKHVSSHSNSPKISEGPAKELMDDISVPDSEEEADDVSNDDQSDIEKDEILEEIEGSVDEDSAKSDEEYDDKRYVRQDHRGRHEAASTELPQHPQAPMLLFFADREPEKFQPKNEEASSWQRFAVVSALPKHSCDDETWVVTDDASSLAQTNKDCVEWQRCVCRVLLSLPHCSKYANLDSVHPMPILFVDATGRVRFGRSWECSCLDVILSEAKLFNGMLFAVGVTCMFLLPHEFNWEAGNMDVKGFP